MQYYNKKTYSIIPRFQNIYYHTGLYHLIIFTTLNSLNSSFYKKMNSFSTINHSFYTYLRKNRNKSKTIMLL